MTTTAWNGFPLVVPEARAHGDLLREALRLVVNEGGRLARDPLQLVTDQHWLDHGVDIAHEPETILAYDVRDTVRRQLYRRTWTTSRDEDVRLYQVAADWPSAVEPSSDTYQFDR